MTLSGMFRATCGSLAAFENSAEIPEEMCRELGAQAVVIDEDKINALGMGLIKTDLISENDAGRHDPDKLCAAVMKIIYEMQPQTHG